MFTGIIEQTGTLVSLVDRGGVRRITVEAPGIASRMREGDSLAVSGVCLTALDPDPTYFHADLARETLDRTSLGSLAAGAKVNLELPTAAGSPLGGHIVQGHVDGTGELCSLEPLVPFSSPNFDRQTTDWTLKVRVPENVRQWMVPKGSVAVEGISLTIAGVSGAPGDRSLSPGLFDGEEITIAILPLTYWRNNLHTLSVGAPMNIEADVLVKLAAMQMQAGKKPHSTSPPPGLSLTATDPAAAAESPAALLPPISPSSPLTCTWTTMRKSPSSVPAAYPRAPRCPIGARISLAAPVNKRLASPALAHRKPVDNFVGRFAVNIFRRPPEPDRALRRKPFFDAGSTTIPHGPQQLLPWDQPSLRFHPHPEGMLSVAPGPPQDDVVRNRKAGAHQHHGDQQKPEQRPQKRVASLVLPYALCVRRLYHRRSPPRVRY